jgi:hypothetical protein
MTNLFRPDAKHYDREAHRTREEKICTDILRDFCKYKDHIARGYTPAPGFFLAIKFLFANILISFKGGEYGITKV